MLVAGAQRDVAGGAEDETLGGQPPGRGGELLAPFRTASSSQPRRLICRARRFAGTRRAGRGNMTDDALTRRRFLGAGAAAGLGAAAAAAPADAVPPPPPAPVPAAEGGRRRRRRGRGRAHGRPRGRQGRQVGDRPGGPQPRRRPGGAEDSARASTPSAARPSSGPPRTTSSRSAATLGIGTYDTYDTGDNVYVNDGQRPPIRDTGATGHGAAGPADRRGPRHRSSPSSTRCRRRCRWTPRGSRPAPRTGTPRRSRAGSTRTASRPSSASSSPPPRARSSAPTRASSRCSTSSSTSPPRATRPTRAPSSATSTPARARQQWRCVGGSQRIPQKLAAQLSRRIILSSPVRRIQQVSGGVRVISDRARSAPST